MANTILIKKIQTAGQVPIASQVKKRELIVDTSTGTFFTQKEDGSIRTVNPIYGPTPQSFTVEFQIPLTAYTFTQNVPGATMGQSVVCSVSGATPNSNAFVDEFEMEPMQAFGMVYAQDSIGFTIACTDSQLLTIGKKTILYYVG